MILKFVGRVIKEDQENQNAVADDSQYSNWDHVERLLYIEVGNGDKTGDQKELELVLQAFVGKIPQIESCMSPVSIHVG